MGWEEVDEGWGRLARDFAYLMEPSWWPEFEQVLRDTGVGEGTRYLDVCCGSGLAAQMAGRRGAVVHGLDASQRLIAIAAARSPDGDIRHGDMNDLPWDDGSFDVVTSFRGIWGGERPGGRGGGPRPEAGRHPGRDLLPDGRTGAVRPVVGVHCQGLRP